MPIEEKLCALEETAHKAAQEITRLNSENQKLRCTLDDIVFEIKEKARRKRTWITNECIRQAEGLEEALEIIEKHTKGERV